MAEGRADLEIKQISLDEAEELFEDHLKRDFPPAELKPFSRMRKMQEEGIYVFYGLFVNKMLSGYAFLVNDNRGGMLLDYLAVFDEMRGMGTGSRFLEVFPKSAGPFSYLIIEVEDPAFASDEEDRTNRERIIGFYERSGVYMTGIRTVVYDAEYAVMLCTPGERYDDVKAHEAVEHMYKTMFTEDVYKNHVRIL